MGFNRTGVPTTPIFAFCGDGIVWQKGSKEAGRHIHTVAIVRRSPLKIALANEGVYPFCPFSSILFILSKNREANYDYLRKLVRCLAWGSRQSKNARQLVSKAPAYARMRTSRTKIDPSSSVSSCVCCAINNEHYLNAPKNAPAS